MNPSPFKADFAARELDVFLLRWLAGGLLEQEQAEWNRILTYDSRFRERFCDWVKGLRDPAGSHAKYRKGART